MSVRAIAVLILAVICGASAALGMSRWQRSLSGPVETVPVLTAKVEITRGRVIDAEMIEVRDWPKQMCPEKVFSKVEDVVGRAVIVQMLPGDVLIEGKVAGKDAGRGLATLVPDGMRAYTIQTSKLASNVAGFVLPHNRVDVLLTLKGNSNDATGGGTSTTLLQAIEILAVDQQLDAPADNRTTDMRSVTLLVSPRQAAFLDLGQNLGQLTLSLRNPLDVAEAKTEPATLADLRFRQERKDGPESLIKNVSALLGNAEDRAPKVSKIRTLRGSQVGEIAIPMAR